MLDRNFGNRLENRTWLLRSASSLPHRPFPIPGSKFQSRSAYRSCSRAIFRRLNGENLHYGEVGLNNGILVTSGAGGYTLVVTGVGQTIEAARDAANVLANKVIVANARYRRDIGHA